VCLLALTEAQAKKELAAEEEQRLASGGIALHSTNGGLYCAPTFQADSRWNGCQFHVDSIHSIWNLFG